MSRDSQPTSNLPPVQPSEPGKRRRKRPNKLGLWIKTHKKTSIAIAAILLILVGGGIVFAVLNSTDEQPVAVKKQEPKKEEPRQIYYSPLTGVEVADEAATKQAVTAIMIENSPDARPQSGLKDSGVVYEAIAEGGITRFLVLYQQEKPELIGPVRSLRPYYIDWLAPYNASVAHVGGSRAALREIRNGSYRDIDQFFNASTYWRAGDRYAPHNVYTNFERIDKLNKEKGYLESEFDSFDRKDASPASEPDAKQISVTMSGPAFNSSYSYNPDNNSYPRSQGGQPHNDREAGQIAPKVVVVMKAPMASIQEDGYRESIKTTGEGAAYIFQDGTVREGRWSKATRDDQLKFTDTSGNIIKLNRGQTWISIIPEGRGGVSWQ